MRITLGKVLSVFIGTGYAIAMFFFSGGDARHQGDLIGIGCLILLLSLALIWFPEQVGAMTGYMGHASVTTESPPIAVSIMGWFFLLVGVPVLMYLLW